jgi:hypothetical protein
MSRHDDSVRLRHILDAARKAVSLTGGKTRAELLADDVAQLALARLLEIIGEAAGKISGEFRAALLVPARDHDVGAQPGVSQGGGTPDSAERAGDDDHGSWHG